MSQLLSMVPSAFHDPHVSSVLLSSSSTLITPVQSLDLHFGGALTRVAAGITGVGGFGGCHAGSGGGLGIFFSFGRAGGPFMGSDGLEAFPFVGWGGVEGGLGGGVEGGGSGGRHVGGGTASTLASPTASPFLFPPPGFSFFSSTIFSPTSSSFFQSLQLHSLQLPSPLCCPPRRLPFPPWSPWSARPCPLPGSAPGTCQARSLWQGYMLATPHGRAMLAMRK